MGGEKVLKFLGSKWFMLGLGILMLLLLPTTYSNFILVYKAGEMGRLWWIPVVFIINLLSAIYAIQRATGMFLSKKRDDQQEWE